MKTLFSLFIKFYQRFISPDKGILKFFFRNPVCVFYPTCSEYAKEAVEKYGIFRGGYLSVIRIFRCHPWQKNHIDPLR